MPKATVNVWDTLIDTGKLAWRKTATRINNTRDLRAGKQKFRGTIPAAHS